MSIWGLLRMNHQFASHPTRPLPRPWRAHRLDVRDEEPGGGAAAGTRETERPGGAVHPEASRRDDA